MGKTKAEIIAEYRELKKENLKLNNQLEHWKAIARKENDRVVDLASELDGKSKELVKWINASREYEETIAKLCIDLDESEKEKTLIQAQRDNLILEHEKMATEFGHIQDDLEILQAEVRKIQYDEEVTYDRAYNEGYSDAEHKFSQAIDHREKEIEDLLDHCDIYWWILRSLHENATK